MQEGELFDAVSAAEASLSGVEYVMVTDTSIAASMRAPVPSLVVYARTAAEGAGGGAGEGEKSEAGAQGVEGVEYEGPHTGLGVTEFVRRHATETVIGIMCMCVARLVIM